MVSGPTLFVFVTKLGEYGNRKVNKVMLVEVLTFPQANQRIMVLC